MQYMQPFGFKCSPKYHPKGSKLLPLILDVGLWLDWLLLWVFIDPPQRSSRPCYQSLKLPFSRMLVHAKKSLQHMHLLLLQTEWPRSAISLISQVSLWWHHIPWYHKLLFPRVNRAEALKCVHSAPFILNIQPQKRYGLSLKRQVSLEKQSRD